MQSNRPISTPPPVSSPSPELSSSIGKKKLYTVALSSLALSVLGVVTAAGLLLAGAISSPIAIPLLVFALVLTSILTGLCLFLRKRRVQAKATTIPTTPLPSLPKPATADKTPITPPSSPVSPAPTAKDYTSILQSQAQYLSSLHDIPLGSITPTQGTTSYSIWGIPSTKTYLISAVGNISDPRFQTSLPNLMLVNAANSRMLPGGGGTNKAFTAAVSPQGWENSKEGKQMLEAGECTVGEWENPDGTRSQQPGLPKYFAQLLGPNASECNNNLDACKKLVFTAYTNCFSRGKSLSSHYIQLPLISSLNFAPSATATVQGQSLQALWIQTVKSSFVQAVVDFAHQHPDYPLLIVIVNKGSPIL